MPYLSTATIMGHLGSDAQSKQIGDSTVTRCNVAVETRKKIDGTWTKVTTWWRVEVWGKQAEWLGRDGTKGALIVATGEASIDEWTDQSGNQKQTLTLRASEAKIVKPKSDAASAHTATAPAPAAAAADTSTTDEPPF